MKIGFVSVEGRGEIDRLLSETAAVLDGQKIRTAGIVKDNGHCSAFANGCDMVVRVRPHGPVIKIAQDLGEGSDACRLDPAAIADAVAQVENGQLDAAHNSRAGVAVGAASPLYFACLDPRVPLGQAVEVPDVFPDFLYRRRNNGAVVHSWHCNPSRVFFKADF